MKFFVAIFLLFIACISQAQDWRDSLAVARKAYQNKEYQKAYQKYESVQKNSPQEVDISIEKGQSAYKNLDYQQAEKIYRDRANQALNKQTKANAYHNLGNALIQQKKYSEAIEAYKESLRNNPSNNQTRHNLEEAMRRLHKKQQQENQKQQNKNQDKNEDQNNKQHQNKKQNNEEKQSKKNKNQTQPKNQSQPSQANNKSKLKDQAVEKKLNDLMKQDAETKRKINGGGEKNTSNSNKDW